LAVRFGGFASIPLAAWRLFFRKKGGFPLNEKPPSAALYFRHEAHRRCASERDSSGRAEAASKCEARRERRGAGADSPTAQKKAPISVLFLCRLAQINPLKIVN
jgi:hypothetical protein